MNNCKISRQKWPDYNLKRTRSILERNRRDISRLIAMLTGHSTIGKHARRLGLQYNERCRSCDALGGEDTVNHFLCECAALCMLRHRTLGSYILDNLTGISDIGLGALIQYLNLSGWV